MNRTRPTIQTYAVIALATLCLILSVLIASELPVRADSGPAATPALSSQDGQECIWSGAAGNGLWSNPANWENGRLPGPADIVRFRGDTPDAHLDAAFGGVIAGLLLDADYTGALTLERSLRVMGDLDMAGGALLGGPADLEIMGAVRVRGGSLVTPSGATMNTVTMDIAAPGVVQMSAHGKLNLSGPGQPLTGDGLLDMTTHAPNSIEYTGAATTDLTAAGPAASLDVSFLDGLSPAGALRMETGTHGLSIALIDPSGRFAYFSRVGNAYPTPGIVVKVDLATFTRVGVLNLADEDTNVRSGVIDPSGRYAYLGTDASPGRVIKIDLLALRRVSALTANEGEDRLRTAIIDPAGNYAYFATYDRPRLVKIDLATFTHAGVAQLSVWRITCAAIDPTGQYAYIGSRSRPGLVGKIDLTTLTEVETLTLNSDEIDLHSATIDPTGTYAYFSTDTTPGRVIKIDLTTFSRADALVIEPSNYTALHSPLMAPSGAYLYYGSTRRVMVTPSYDGRIVRIDLGTFTFVDDLELSRQIGSPRSAVIAPDGAYAYVSAAPYGESYYAGRVVKVALADLSLVDVLDLEIRGEDEFHSAVIDPDGRYAYFGTDTEPGIVVKVDLATFKRVGALTLNSMERFVHSAVMDPAGRYAYFGTWGGIVQVDLHNFTRIASLRYTYGYDSGRHASAVIDPAGQYAYFGTHTFFGPYYVERVDLTTFSEAGSLRLDGITGWPIAAAMDPAGVYGYFVTDDSPAVILKVHLPSLTLADTLTLSQGRLYSAVMDPGGGYAYFGAAASGGGVIRLDLSAFAVTDYLYLGFTPKTGVVDPAGQYACFGGSRSVACLDLNTFTQEGAVMLPGNQFDQLSAAAIAPDGGYAYFGSLGVPANVYRVALATLSASPFSALISPDGGALFSSVDQTAYQFPSAAFANPVLLTHTPLSQTTMRQSFAPMSSDPLTGIGYFFEATAVYSDTATAADLAPGATYTITVGYTDRQLGDVDEVTLALYRYDSNAWSQVGVLSSVVDLGANRVTAVVNSLGIFGVFGEGERKVYLPMVLHNTP